MERSRKEGTFTKRELETKRKETDKAEKVAEKATKFLEGLRNSENPVIKTVAQSYPEPSEACNEEIEPPPPVNPEKKLDAKTMKVLERVFKVIRILLPPEWAQSLNDAILKEFAKNEA